MTPKLPFLASLLALSATTYSLSAPVNVLPELTLAPGLPTLESLGLKVADLYEPNFLGNDKPNVQTKKKSHSPIPESRNLSVPLAPVRSPGGASARATFPACYGDAPAARRDAIACRNALISVGGYRCDVAGAYSVLCRAGSAEIVGWNYYNVTVGVAAYCSDVAVGASWAIDHCSGCPQDYCPVEGELLQGVVEMGANVTGAQTANRNPYYVVFVDRNSKYEALALDSRPWVREEGRVGPGLRSLH